MRQGQFRSDDEPVVETKDDPAEIAPSKPATPGFWGSIANSFKIGTSTAKAGFFGMFSGFASKEAARHAANEEKYAAIDRSTRVDSSDEEDDDTGTEADAPMEYMEPTPCDSSPSSMSCFWYLTKNSMQRTVSATGRALWSNLDVAAREKEKKARQHARDLEDKQRAQAQNSLAVDADPVVQSVSSKDDSTDRTV